MVYNNTISTMGQSNGQAKMFPNSSVDDNSSFPNGTVIMMAPNQNSIQSITTPQNLTGTQIFDMNTHNNT